MIIKDSHKFFTICLMIFLMASCNSKEDNLEKEYKKMMPKLSRLVDDKQCYNNNIVNISVSAMVNKDIVNPIKFIKLCSDGAELIGSIDKIIIFKNKYYILDKVTNTVFIINNDGTFHSKLHNPGKGTDEYIRLSDFCIDQDREIILLYDSQLHKMLYFSLNGDFVKSKRSPLWFKEFIQMDNGGFCLLTLGNNFSGSKMLFTDSLLVPTEKAISTQSKYHLNLFSKSSLLKGYSGHFSISYPFSDKVYFLSSDSLYVKYQFKRENMIFKSWDDVPITMKEFKDKLSDLKGDQFLFKGGFIENADYSLFEMANNKNAATLIYSKETESVSNCNLWLDDVFILPFPCVVIDKNFGSIIDPQWMIKFKDDLLSNNIVNSTFYDDFTISSNPVLILYKIKK